MKSISTSPYRMIGSHLDVQPKLANHGSMKYRSQQGVALIVVLLLLAIMITIAASMSERLFIQFQRASKQINYQQAYWYSMGVESLAALGIKESYRDNNTINLSQPWAHKRQQYPLEYGSAAGQITDKQACFNLNALATVPVITSNEQKPYLVSVWQHLLETLELEPYQAEVIADATREYIDSNDSVDSMTGVEDSYYESMTPAYLAPNSLLADSSELRAINQLDGNIMLQLQPYVCALPTTQWQLNVNTLPAEQAALLTALFSPYLSQGDAQNILENRPFDGWNSVDAFLSESAISGISEELRKKVIPYLSVDSAYFELDAQILVDGSRIRLRSLFFSNDRKTVTVVRRRFGGISE